MEYNKRHFSGTTELEKPTGEVEEFWALKDVFFEVERGQVVGIIGRNGAGKSTLLKVLSRITEMTRGRVSLSGRVAALLEVGTGFHPELTGRENIFLNGAILGMHRSEIREKFDEIVHFAEVERFLDTPVKRYSSGMYVRLAFAVAAHLESEILLVDEVLAVGDAAFQKKCLGKIKNVASDGRTVLFVSHNMPMVKKLCSRAIVLSEGSVTFDGNVTKGVDHYMSLSAAAETIKLEDRLDRRGDGGLRFTDVCISGPSGVRNLVLMGEAAEIKLAFNAKNIVSVCDVSIHILNQMDQTILRYSTMETSASFQNLGGKGILTCKIPPIQILPGNYSLLVAASVPPRYQYLDYVENAATFEVQPNDVFGTGKVPEHGVYYTECDWVLGDE